MHIKVITLHTSQGGTVYREEGCTQMMSTLFQDYYCRPTHAFSGLENKICHPFVRDLLKIHQLLNKARMKMKIIEHTHTSNLW
jgi:hypothetical protein